MMRELAQQLRCEEQGWHDSLLRKRNQQLFHGLFHRVNYVKAMTKYYFSKLYIGVRVFTETLYK